MAVLVNALQLGKSAGNPPVTSDPPTDATTGSDLKPETVSSAAAPRPVDLDSQIQAAPEDQETIVFDGTLHSAAPVPAAPPQAALAGAGRPVWLLNSQPVYTAREGSDKIDAPSPLQPANTNNSTPEVSADARPAQPAAPASSNNNIQQDITVPLQNASPSGGQAPDKPDANSSQPKPAVDSAQTSHTSPISPEPSPQTGSGQSSPDNTPGFEKDTKHTAAGPETTRQPEAAAPGLPVFTTSDPGPNRVDTPAQANSAAAASSKPGVLPIDQQADTRQPLMKTDLNMRIQGQSGESINLRISERAGDIQISVRSSDQSTANVLKHELPSIEAGLERAGWRMENNGMSQSGQDQHEAGRDSQTPDRNRDQNGQSSNWQDRNQRRKDSSTNAWFELDQ